MIRTLTSSPLPKEGHIWPQNGEMIHCERERGGMLDYVNSAIWRMRTSHLDNFFFLPLPPPNLFLVGAGKWSGNLRIVTRRRRSHFERGASPGWALTYSVKSHGKSIFLSPRRKTCLPLPFPLQQSSSMYTLSNGWMFSHYPLMCLSFPSSPSLSPTGSKLQFWFAHLIRGLSTARERARERLSPGDEWVSQQKQWQSQN